jgi:hypothetical protein
MSDMLEPNKRAVTALSTVPEGGNEKRDTGSPMPRFRFLKQSILYGT